MNSSSRRRRRRRILSLALLALVAAGAASYFLLIRGSDKSTSAAPATEVVKSGDVRSTVAGVGTLQPAKSVSLGFGEGGRVKSVEVHLGEKVEAGQVLARLDDTLAQASLGAARTQVSAAQAKVTQLIEGHTPAERDKVSVATRTAQHTADGARRTAAKARAVAADQVKTLRTALTQARKAHQVAVNRLAENRSKLQTKTERAASEKTIRDSARVGVEEARAQIVALAGTKEANRKKAEEEEAKERKKIEEEEKKEREKAADEEKEFKGREGSGTVITRNPETSTIAAEAAVQQSLETAQTHLTDATSSYEKFRGEMETIRTSLPSLRDTVRSTAETEATAKTALQSGVSTAAQSVRTANEAAETAQATLSNALASGAAEIQPTKSGELAEAMSAVSQAESTVITDEKKLEETVLRAPSAGRVSNLKLSVGDVVTGGQTSQVKAGASTEGSSESSGSSESGSTSSGTSSSSGSPSIVLNSPRLHLFAVSLTQADAVKVKAGDTATLTIDALSRTVKGRLVSITPLPAIKNGVVNYTATVATSDLPQKLRTGMTAEVTLLTAESHNVPVLSPAALPASTGTVKVQVLKGGKPEERTVQLGLVGDAAVEIKKGLAVGDRVILPTQPEAGGEEEFGGEEEGFGEEGGGFE